MDKNGISYDDEIQHEQHLFWRAGRNMVLSAERLADNLRFAERLEDTDVTCEEISQILMAMVEEVEEARSIATRAQLIAVDHLGDRIADRVAERLAVASE
ncbi:hypothetical protein D4R08_07910 [Corynebacterium xerosis]|uniref:hypothetical protein n=1 Tax=Corynebacterium xerosis TaxID=1725 RepID=UPI000EB5CBAD|nr:hypothetical protein [Corynebacterium xerosis]AYJ33232.1 hypothetical protein D4R08_07910 [Corynebacterium xerosis]